MAASMGLVGPVETSNNKPITWPVQTDGSPTHITVSVASTNFPADSGISAPFSDPWPAMFTPLLVAAEDAWETAANIKFDNIPDTSTTPENSADIRVGLSLLSKGVTPSTMGFIGFTHYHWNAANVMQPDVTVVIDDPADTPVTALADGNFQYNGFQTTVFQDMLHELGHAIGLAHNPDDPTAIMNPLLSSKNPYIDPQDAAAAQSLYGVSRPDLMLSQTEINVLGKLLGLLPA